MSFHPLHKFAIITYFQFYWRYLRFWCRLGIQHCRRHCWTCFSLNRNVRTCVQHGLITFSNWIVEINVLLFIYGIFLENHLTKWIKTWKDFSWDDSLSIFSFCANQTFWMAIKYFHLKHMEYLVTVIFRNSLILCYSW